MHDFIGVPIAVILMLNRAERRALVYAAVAALEPYASANLVQHYVARRHDLALPLLVVFLHLEVLAQMGRLVRRTRPRLGGSEPTFFWETLGLVLVEPDRPDPNNLTAAVFPDRDVMEELAPPQRSLPRELVSSRTSDAHQVLGSAAG